MPSKTLFAAKDAEEALVRIDRLRADSKAAWGKMDCAQMLAHCQMPLRVATGEVKLKRMLIGVLFGRLAKKKLMKPGEYDKNMPTHPSFRMNGPHDFATEKAELVRLVRAFQQGGPRVLTTEPHAFFGPMTQEEWEILMWRHLDHHLRQFGV